MSGSPIRRAMCLTAVLAVALPPFLLRAHGGEMSGQGKPALILVSGDEYVGAIIPAELVGATAWTTTSTDIQTFETDLRRVLGRGV
jgi:hypothetical protein